MSEYVGSVGSRISLEVKLINDFSFESHFGFASQTNYIYTMQDSNGNVLVWKTTSCLVFDWIDNNGDYQCDAIRKGDTMKITGTVKEHSEYKGTKQTVLTRCKFALIAHKPDEVAAKREEQMQSISEGDWIWEMPYKQYKDHYSDCETLKGSYNDHEGKDVPTIKVIIRKGRLKPSGTRGKHYSGYEFQTEEGKRVCYRGISEDTARKRMVKDFPNGANWECVKIYDYRNYYRHF